MGKQLVSPQSVPKATDGVMMKPQMAQESTKRKMSGEYPFDASGPCAFCASCGQGFRFVLLVMFVVSSRTVFR
jgi:hypothetical protein